LIITFPSILVSSNPVLHIPYVKLKTI